MAVRTREAGIKRKRRMTSADEPQRNVQASKGKKTVPRDQAAALRRQRLLEKVTPGPAMTEPPPGLGPATTEVRPGKKTLTRRKLKRSGA